MTAKPRESGCNWITSLNFGTCDAPPTSLRKGFLLCDKHVAEWDAGQTGPSPAEAEAKDKSDDRPA